MLDGTVGNHILISGRDQTFVKGKIDIGKRDALRGARKPPSPGMAFFRCEQSRFAQPTQNPSDDNRICSRMRSDVRRGANTIRFPGHMAERMQGERKTTVSLQTGAPLNIWFK